MPKLLWNAIVKNEVGRIERAAESAMQWIDSAVILDTGSTDGTQDKLKSIFEHYKVPLLLGQTEFKNFSQARNEALRAAKSFGVQRGVDFIMLMDADMELVALHPEWRDLLKGPSCDMFQIAGGVYYVNRRFISPHVPGEYIGVTHEYLACDTAGVVDKNAAYFRDYADGTNRKDKFLRDIKLLKAGLKDEPKNERYMYYLAQSYRDAGKYEKAIKWYTKRIEAGGWNEEVWHAEYCIALCYGAMGDEDAFIRTLLSAYNHRPTRLEPLYHAARYWREKGHNALAIMASKMAMTIPRPNDVLFIEDYPYAVGAREEFSIAGYYLSAEQDAAFRVTNDLTLENQPWEPARELAKTNIYHYLRPLKAWCPSWESRPIPFTPEPNWAPMNPSVTRFGPSVVCNVRTVNYQMDEHGRYSLRPDGRFVDDDNPIRTRNFLVDFGADPFSQTAPPATEILAPADLPVRYKGVIGFEDMRLFEWKNQLWSVSAVRQLAQDSLPEQVTARLVDERATYRLEDIKQILRQPRQCEKNWMPFVQDNGDKLEFMYRLGHVVDIHGNDVKQVPTGLLTDQIAGGAQVIPFDEGWLALVHEARPIPGRSIRFYQHRFAWFNTGLELRRLTMPFFFNDKIIEHADGMCWAPDGTILISYGVADKEAHIGRLHPTDLRNFIWHPQK